MSLRTEELESIMDQFEKDVKKNLYVPRMARVTKEERANVPDSFFYHGPENELFKAYLLGYEFGQKKASEEGI